LFGAEHADGPRLTPTQLGEMLHPAGRDAAALLATIIEQTDAMNGDRPLADDIAAIAVRRAE